MAASPAPSTTREGRHELPGGGHLAYRLTAPAGCSKGQQGGGSGSIGVLFLHGLLSDMRGIKARALEADAQQRGHTYLCFDARGHGSSSGTFIDTHLGDWYADAATALLQLSPAERHVIVGSSFGGWQALHLAAEHPGLVAGLVLVAPALDYTSRAWAGLGEQRRAEALACGRASLGSGYLDGGGIEVGLHFFQQAERFLCLDRLHELEVACPVRILHGVEDDVVPVEVGRAVFERLRVQDMSLCLIKDADHRLSSPRDLRMLLSAVDELLSGAARK